MFKMVKVDKRKAIEIGKPVFTFDGDVYLVYLNERRDKGVPYFFCKDDFEITQMVDWESLSPKKKGYWVVDFGVSYPEMNKLLKYKDNGIEVRFTGSGLINDTSLPLGYASAELVERKLGCKIKENKSFVFKDFIEVVELGSDVEFNVFDPKKVSIEGIRFGIRQGSSSRKVKTPFKKRKQLFETGKVEF